MKQKFAQAVRILTTPPVFSALMCTLLYVLVPGSFASLGHYLLAIVCLSLLPVLAYFQQLPLLGIVLNVLMLPWASGLICLYLLTLLCLPLPGVGAVMGQAAALATRALVGSVMSLAKLPMAYLWTSQPNVVTMLAVGTLACPVDAKLASRKGARGAGKRGGNLCGCFAAAAAVLWHKLGAA